MSSQVGASPNRSARTHRELREGLLFLAFVGPNLGFFAVFTFWPLLYNAYLSLTEWDMIAPLKQLVGLRDYSEAIADLLFLKVLGNTFVLTGGAVAVTLGLGLGFALLLNSGSLAGMRHGRLSSRRLCCPARRSPSSGSTSSTQPTD